MENTEQKNKACYSCGEFYGYYTKGQSRFVRTKVGFCRKSRSIVDNSECCEGWYSISRKRYTCKKTALRVLSEMLDNIANIKQLLQEAQEETEEI